MPIGQVPLLAPLQNLGPLCFSSFSPNSPTLQRSKSPIDRRYTFSLHEERAVELVRQGEQFLQPRFLPRIKS